MKLQIPTADMKTALKGALTGALNVEKQLGVDAQAQVKQLVDELYPLVVAQTQAMLTSSNPAVAQTYLAVLQGCVDATIARLGLHALQQQRQVIASSLQTAVQILVMVLRAAVIA